MRGETDPPCLPIELQGFAGHANHRSAAHRGGPTVNGRKGTILHERSDAQAAQGKPTVGAVLVDAASLDGVPVAAHPTLTHIVSN